MKSLPTNSKHYFLPDSDSNSDATNSSGEDPIPKKTSTRPESEKSGIFPPPPKHFSTLQQSQPLKPIQSSKTVDTELLFSKSSDPKAFPESEASISFGNTSYF